MSASIWRWFREGGEWKAEKVITIPAEPADAADLPPALQPFGAVPPLVSDIDLSVDDRWLYVSCWGTGELKQYDVSDPRHPRETGSVRLGGIARRAPHPAAPGLRLAGAPQMVEISRDGKRVYVTNSLYAAWDDVFYPDGVGAWAAKLDADTERGGLPLPAAALVFAAAWQIMIAAMMLPAALPAVGAFSRQDRRPGARAGLAPFLGAYFAVWTAFGIVALAADAGLHAVAESWGWLGDRPSLVAAGVLLLAAVYQFLPVKRRCLAGCRLMRTRKDWACHSPEDLRYGQCL